MILDDNSRISLSNNDSGTDNTVFGKDAGSNVTGDRNTFVGRYSGHTNTSGDDNTYIGAAAGQANSGTGDDNTYIGSHAGYQHDGGSSNTAVGRSSLTAITSGDYNTAVGGRALDSMATGTGNTAVGYDAGGVFTGGGGVFMGYEAGLSLTSGDTALIGYQAGKRMVGTGNVGLGYGVLYGASSTAANNTGTYKTAMGVQALRWVSKTVGSTGIGAEAGYYITGSYNTFVGYKSGYGSITSAPYSSGGNNTAVGYATLHNTTSGNDNVAIGYRAGIATTSASGSVMIGSGAGSNITTAPGSVGIGYEALQSKTGGGSVGIGYQAGNSITTGGQNIVICARSSDTSAVNSENQIVIGDNIAGTANFQVSIGAASNIISNSFNSNATWARNSDLHKKTNIEETNLGLSFINELRPVTFNWRPNSEFPEHYKDYKENENDMDTETNLYGMIAQDVEKALDKVGHKNFGGWSKEEDGSQRLAQSMFVYPLIKAVQELSAQVEELKNTKCKCNEE